MITRIADIISTFFCDQMIIKTNEKAKFRYGLEIMISTIIGFAVIILTGTIFGSTKIAILYLVSLVPLRMYTGGYHAHTYLTCNLVFALIFLLNLFLYRLVITYDYEEILLGITIFSALSIWKYAPIENKNKKLTLMQESKYRNISKMLYGIYYFVSLALIHKGNDCGVVVLLVMNTVSILVWEVKISEKIKLSAVKVCS